jgi:ribosomal protein S27AE
MIQKMRHSTREEIKGRIAKYYEITPEEYKKIAEESRRCPICGGRPILHMRLCMRPDMKEKIIKLKKVI